MFWAIPALSSQFVPLNVFWDQLMTGVDAIVSDGAVCQLLEKMLLFCCRRGRGPAARTARYCALCKWPCLRHTAACLSEGPCGGLPTGAKNRETLVLAPAGAAFSAERLLAGLDQRQQQQQCLREWSVCPAALSFAPVFLSQLAEKDTLICGSKISPHARENLSRCSPAQQRFSLCWLHITFWLPPSRSGDFERVLQLLGRMTMGTDPVLQAGLGSWAPRWSWCRSRVTHACYTPLPIKATSGGDVAVRLGLSPRVTECHAAGTGSGQAWAFLRARILLPPNS